MRLGIYGGTFDPVHLGHLLLAEQCREQCSLDQVWFVPAGIPPHKQDATHTPAATRVEMLELAIAGQPAFAVSRLEIERSGPSYTIETLRQIQSAQPEDELSFLVGADSLKELATWREPRGIVEIAELVVVNRGASASLALDPVRRALGDAAAARIRFVEMPAVEFASRDIRRRAREGRSLRYLVPRAVEQFIEERGLYRD